MVPMNTFKKLGKHKNAGIGLEITISKNNIRKQRGGSGGPRLGKSLAGGSPRIGNPFGRPPPFIGTCGKQYGSNPWMSMIEQLNKAELKLVDHSKNTLTKKIMVNGSIFLTLNCNFLVGLPSLEATSNRTTCQNTVFQISSSWKSCKSGQK